jgi:hypothetical protein
MFAMSTQKYLLAVAILVILIFTGACNYPRSGVSTQDASGLIHTIAAQTVEAQMTLDAASSGGDSGTGDDQGGTGDQQGTSLTPTSTDTPFPTSTQAVIFTNTPAPTATATAVPCDRITWVKDVTIPDGTDLVPGESFTKTWRLRNSGTCTWTSGYSLAFQSGDSMGAPANTQLTTGTVAPGQEIDVSIELEAPTSAGTYQGYFKLRNTDGNVFGIGSDSDAFWVKIDVPEVSGVMLDFIATADEADWGSGVTPIDFSDPGDIQLDYGSPVTITNGYVTTQKNIVIEDGSTTGVILETYPKNETDGYIVGRYPEYKVGAGDYISARIGFLAEGNGSCGAGSAIFRINYTIGGDLNTMTKLDSWKETCDGKLRKIFIDLTSLKGKTIQFYLILLADGAPTDDKAIWDSLGVMR